MFKVKIKIAQNDIQTGQLMTVCNCLSVQSNTFQRDFNVRLSDKPIHFFILTTSGNDVVVII